MPDIARYHPSPEMVTRLSDFLDILTTDILKEIKDVPPEVAAIGAVEITKGLLDFMLKSVTEELSIEVVDEDEEDDGETVH